jgi:hypothetical protein
MASMVELLFVTEYQGLGFKVGFGRSADEPRTSTVLFNRG